MLRSPFLDNSSKISFTVLHGSALGDKRLSKIDIELEHLLKLQHSQPNEGKYKYRRLDILRLISLAI
jgi:hypothetical protein